MADADTVQEERQPRWSGAFMSLLLMGFTGLIAVLCVMALASTLTQSRVSSLSIDGVSISIWKLDSLRAQWSQLHDQRIKQKDAFAQVVQDRIGAIGKQSSAGSEVTNSEAKLGSVLTKISVRVRSVNEDLAGQLVVPELPVVDKIALLSAANIDVQSSTDPALKELLTLARKMSDEYLIALANERHLETVVNGLNQKRDLLKAGMNDTDDDVTALFKPIKSPMDGATQSRLENALYELYPPGISGIINRFVILQTDVLTLLLVILMGILGSALQILHSFYGAQRAEPFGSYVLRLGTGAVTALVVFIVAKAGLPVIADASKLSGEAPINPYSISFIAIVSGLLSEQAILTVQAQGQRFFANGNTEPDRWALRDLTPDVQVSGMSIKSLANYLGLSEDEANDILKGTNKADIGQQRAIAIYLRRAVRDLFSDMPPTYPNPSGTPTPGASPPQGDAQQKGVG
jgi:hypothetical protein